MLTNTAVSAVDLLTPGAKADTTAATGSWVSVANYEGTLLITQHIGTVTAGTIDGKIRDATDGSGTGAADVTGAAFTQVTTANDPATEVIRVSCNGLRAYIQYVGTIATGPADVCVSVIGTPKY